MFETKHLNNKKKCVCDCDSVAPSSFYSSVELNLWEFLQPADKSVTLAIKHSSPDVQMIDAVLREFGNSALQGRQ